MLEAEDHNFQSKVDNQLRRRHRRSHNSRRHCNIVQKPHLNTSGRRLQNRINPFQRGPRELGWVQELEKHGGLGYSRGYLGSPMACRERASW